MQVWVGAVLLRRSRPIVISMPYLIYIVTNTVNGKRYVGLTTLTVQTRWKQHCAAARRKRPLAPFGAAIRKYGPDAFDVAEFACAFDRPGLSDLEQIVIAQEGTKNRTSGYNATLGGDGGIGAERSDEFKKRLSILRQGNTFSVGAVRTESHRKAISRAHIGKVVSHETREKLRQANIGRAHTDASRAKMSEGMRARCAAGWRPNYEVIAAKNSIAKKGQKLTPSHRDALSMGNRKSHACTLHIKRLRLILDTRKIEDTRQFDLSLVPPDLT